MMDREFLPKELAPEQKLPRLFDLTGRVAVVTGGAGLLGEEFCRTLAEAGAKVVIADANALAAKKLADSIAIINSLTSHIRDEPAREAQQCTLPVEMEVTDQTSVRNMVSMTLQTFGRLDILVNCAALDPKFDPNHAINGPSRAANHKPPARGESEGLESSQAFEGFPLEAWNQALSVNLTGVFLCCQAAVKPMILQGEGVIVNLSSIYGLVAPDQRLYQRSNRSPQYKPVYYSVTKFGILGLTQYLATYYAGKNIRVNAISPGGVYNGHDDDFVRAYSTRTVLGRMAEKDEINGALLFLVSDASKYMTGANLVVDGGWTTW
jgi:NAD(P)-dependent dehydrogenase (short-subunit alcohol dehydrogenase family)